MPDPAMQSHARDAPTLGSAAHVRGVQRELAQLRAGPRSGECLVAAAAVLSVAQLDDVVEERCLGDRCGYPDCGRGDSRVSLQHPSRALSLIAAARERTQQVHARPSSFCSPWCARACAHYASQLQMHGFVTRAATSAPRAAVALLRRPAGDHDSAAAADDAFTAGISDMLAGMSVQHEEGGIAAAVPANGLVRERATEAVIQPQLQDVFGSSGGGGIEGYIPRSRPFVAAAAPVRGLPRPAVAQTGVGAAAASVSPPIRPSVAGGVPLVPSATPPTMMAGRVNLSQLRAARVAADAAKRVEARAWRAAGGGGLSAAALAARAHTTTEGVSLPPSTLPSPSAAANDISGLRRLTPHKDDPARNTSTGAAPLAAGGVGYGGHAAVEPDDFDPFIRPVKSRQVRDGGGGDNLAKMRDTARSPGAASASVCPIRGSTAASAAASTSSSSGRQPSPAAALSVGSVSSSSTTASSPLPPTTFMSGSMATDVATPLMGDEDDNSSAAYSSSTLAAATVATTATTAPPLSAPTPTAASITPATDAHIQQYCRAVFGDNGGSDDEDYDYDDDDEGEGDAVGGIWLYDDSAAPSTAAPTPARATGSSSSSSSSSSRRPGLAELERAEAAQDAEAIRAEGAHAIIGIGHITAIGLAFDAVAGSPTTAAPSDTSAADVRASSATAADDGLDGNKLLGVAGEGRPQQSAAAAATSSSLPPRRRRGTKRFVGANNSGVPPTHPAATAAASDDIDDGDGDDTTRHAGGEASGDDDDDDDEGEVDYSRRPANLPRGRLVDHVRALEASTSGAAAVPSSSPRTSTSASTADDTSSAQVSTSTHPVASTAGPITVPLSGMQLFGLDAFGVLMACVSTWRTAATEALLVHRGGLLERLHTAAPSTPTNSGVNVSAGSHGVSHVGSTSLDMGRSGGATRIPSSESGVIVARRALLEASLQTAATALVTAAAAQAPTASSSSISEGVPATASTPAGGGRDYKLGAAGSGVWRDGGLVREIGEGAPLLQQQQQQDASSGRVSGGGGGSDPMAISLSSTSGGGTSISSGNNISIPSPIDLLLAPFRCGGSGVSGVSTTSCISALVSTFDVSSPIPALEPRHWQCLALAALAALGDAACHSSPQPQAMPAAALKSGGGGGGGVSDIAGGVAASFPTLSSTPSRAPPPPAPHHYDVDGVAVPPALLAGLSVFTATDVLGAVALGDTGAGVGGGAAQAPWSPPSPDQLALLQFVLVFGVEERWPGVAPLQPSSSTASSSLRAPAASSPTSSSSASRSAGGSGGSSGSAAASVLAGGSGGGKRDAAAMLAQAELDMVAAARRMAGLPGVPRI